jgi:hypothetical protein
MLEHIFSKHVKVVSEEYSKEKHVHKHASDDVQQTVYGICEIRKYNRKQHFLMSSKHSVKNMQKNN